MTQLVGGAAAIDQLLEDVCIAPAAQRLDSTQALFYEKQIADCFDQPSLPDVLAAVERGGSAWHEQVLEQLNASLTCDHCGDTAEEADVPKFKKCGGCMVARYCNNECATAAWKGHSKECHERIRRLCLQDEEFAQKAKEGIERTR